LIKFSANSPPAEHDNNLYEKPNIRKNDNISGIGKSYSFTADRIPLSTFKVDVITSGEMGIMKISTFLIKLSSGTTFVKNSVAYSGKFI